MLNDSEKMEFFFLKDFHDMRCKYDRVLSVIRQQMNREPHYGEAFIMMSRDRRTVRIYRYDDRACVLHEKRFHAGYQFMKVVHEDGKQVFRIEWKEICRILNCPAIKMLKIK